MRADGTVVAVGGVVLDQSQRKRAEADRKRLMAAIEQTGEIIVITDPMGTIQYVNPAFTQATGYARQEVLGQTPRLLKSGEHNRSFYADLWKTIARGERWEGRFVNRRKDGTTYIEEATISPVRGQAGNIVNYVAVKRDITEQLRLNEEKAELAAQLNHAQKMESVGRLAGGVAHDLNNLLTPILGYGELLLNDFEGDDARKADVEKIVQAACRARDLVRQLLAFSRKQVLAFEPVDLNKVLDGFEKLLRRTIREDVTIDFILAPTVPLIKGDIGQLEQVIMNLAVNAQDAMPHGGNLTIQTSVVELDQTYVAAHQDLGPGLYVMLGVNDTGCGMDARIRERLFEPFFTTKEKGTGLGLATVYGIVKQHGGHIWVYSEPGHGTIFKIYLPVAEDPGEPKESSTLEISADWSGTETILLVEDDEQVRNLSHTILKQQGYTVLTAKNGREALATADRHDGPLHLLLTDVVLPDVNGKELFARISAEFPEMKVLYMSGYTDDVIAHHGVLDEGVHFIQKPFSVQFLIARVRKVLSQD
jgi:PAS domain S-box-containing protein